MTDDARWPVWTGPRLLMALAWLTLTVGLGIVWIVAAMFGSSLSPDNPEVEGPVRFTLVGGALGTAGFVGVWLLRRSRGWLVAGGLFAALSVASAAAFLLGL